jgi:hypothetical protein
MADKERTRGADLGFRLSRKAGRFDVETIGTLENAINQGSPSTLVHASFEFYRLTTCYKLVPCLSFHRIWGLMENGGLKKLNMRRALRPRSRLSPRWQAEIRTARTAFIFRLQHRQTSANRRRNGRAGSALFETPSFAMKDGTVIFLAWPAFSENFSKDVKNS